MEISLGSRWVAGDRSLGFDMFLQSGKWCTSNFSICPVNLLTIFENMFSTCLTDAKLLKPNVFCPFVLLVSFNEVLGVQ